MRALPTAAVALAGVLTACQPDPTGGPPPAPAEGSYGLVVLSHDFDTPGVAVSGQWMRYRGQARTTALHALAQPEHAWMVAAPPAEGTCRPLVAGGALDTRASIDLLDIGTLQITPPEPLAGAALSLTPRPLPPIAFFAINGVVYDADAPEELPYLSGGTYRVHADGAEAGPVHGDVQAASPIWLDQHRFADTGLEIMWGGASDARIVLARDVGSQTLGIECYGTDGAMEVPFEALAVLGSGPASLTVSRVRRAPLKMPGFARADLLFVARDGRDIVIPEIEEGPQR